MEIKAIQTEYAGCRFRSRLEARWAVFFDTLGVDWQYEPQGYEGNGVRYLPDFLLPEWDLFVEVKGELGHADYMKIMAAVPALKAPPDKQTCPTLLILGPVPRPGAVWLHIRLDLIMGAIKVQQAFFEANGWARAYDDGGVIKGLRGDLGPEETEWARRLWLDPRPDGRLIVDPLVDEAYRAARSARFEFGQPPRGVGER